ncbi:brain protein I3 [Suricata suricatta]|nr:brain protein I3 [Suricata suricatta]
MTASCQPLPILCWSIRGCSQALSSGSIPTARGSSLKPAMTTVQAAGIPTHHPRVYNIHSRNVTRYPANSIVVVGGCPVCRVGVLEDSFTFLGIFLAIILFPFGFICCFALRKRRCPNCGANFT